MTDDFAPSEEFTLLCDVGDCEASLSMVSEIERSEHRWGRISVYEATKAVGFPVTKDFDLCALHYAAIKEVLGL